MHVCKRFYCNLLDIHHLTSSIHKSCHLKCQFTIFLVKKL